MARIIETIKHGFTRELTYPVTRPYPFRRPFKLSVAAGFFLLLCLFILFSIANLAYELQPAYTITPNATESKSYWFNAWPFSFGDDKLQPKCQPLDMPVAHAFMTSNLGLQYEVDRVTFDGKDRTQGLAGDLRPSVPYHDHVLTNCEVDRIAIAMQKTDQSRPGDSAWYSWRSSRAVAYAHCQIPSDQGMYNVNFSTVYSSINEEYRFLAVDDPRNSSSLWWGARLLNNYFFGLQTILARPLMQGNDNKTNKAITQAEITFRRGPTTDIKAHDLFSVEYFFLLYDGDRVTDETDEEIGADTTKLYNNPDRRWSKPMTEGFMFAKVLRSMILIDLGDEQTPNLLLKEPDLKYVLAATDDFNRQGSQDGLLSRGNITGWWRTRGISPPSQLEKTGETAVEMNQAYDAFGNATGPLGTKPARIYAQYSCLVPVRKGTGTTLLFVLVAVLSLMQSAWALFKWFAEIAVEIEGNPSAMFCEGCPVTSPVGEYSAGEYTAGLLKHAAKIEQEEIDLGSSPPRLYRPL